MCVCWCVRQCVRTLLLPPGHEVHHSVAGVPDTVQQILPRGVGAERNRCGPTAAIVVQHVHNGLQQHNVASSAPLRYNFHVHTRTHARTHARTHKHTHINITIRTTITIINPVLPVHTTRSCFIADGCVRVQWTETGAPGLHGPIVLRRARPSAARPESGTVTTPPPPTTVKTALATALR